MPPSKEAVLKEIERKSEVINNHFWYVNPSDIVETLDTYSAARVAEAVAAERATGDIQNALKLVLPMAKAWAHAHDVGSNKRYVEFAESILTPPEDAKTV